MWPWFSVVLLQALLVLHSSQELSLRVRMKNYVLPDCKRDSCQLEFCTVPFTFIWNGSSSFENSSSSPDLTLIWAFTFLHAPLQDSRYVLVSLAFMVPMTTVKTYVKYVFRLKFGSHIFTTHPSLKVWILSSVGKVPESFRYRAHIRHHSCYPSPKKFYSGTRRRG